MDDHNLHLKIKHFTVGKVCKQYCFNYKMMTLKIYGVGRNRPRCNKINCLPNITLPIFRCQSTARKTLSIYFVSLGQPNYFYCTCNICSTEGRLKIGLKSTMHDWLIPRDDTHAHISHTWCKRKWYSLWGLCSWI